MNLEAGTWRFFTLAPSSELETCPSSSEELVLSRSVLPLSCFEEVEGLLGFTPSLSRDVNRAELWLW